MILDGAPSPIKKLLQKALDSGNLKNRYRYFYQAEKMLLDDAAVLPIYVYSFNTMIKPYVHGFYPNYRDEHPLRNVFIQNRKVK